MKKIEWEQFGPDNDKTPDRYSTIANIWRTKVPGGWLVCYYASNNQALVYIPDAKYDWDKMIEVK